MKSSKLVRLPLLLLLAIVPASFHAQTTSNPANLPQRDGSHDFDFLIGNWKAHVRRLPDRLDNSDIWIEYDGFSKHKKLLDSNANFEEFEVTSTDKKLHIKAQTLRLYNPTSHQWSTIWSMWITGLSACLPSLASLQGIAASFSTRRLQRPSHSRALRLAQPLTQRRAHGAVVLT